MIFIQNDKTKTVNVYHTSSKVEKAVKAVLKQDENLTYSETHKGYVVKVVEEKAGE